MTAWHTLLFYSVVIALGSYLGGLLPRLITMTHTRTQLAMSTVSGLMLGVAFYHLLPHSLGEFGPQYSIDDVVWWLMIGLVSMLLLLRLFHFHQHDFSVAADHAHCDHHDHLHAPQQTSQHVSHFSWAGIALGLSVHTIIDGIALAAVVLAAQTSATHAAWVGLGVFIAIFLHKPLDAISIATLTRASGLSRQKQHLINMGFALMCPLGAVLFYLGFNAFDGLSSAWLGGTLAFAAGAFICIALSDLMPEVHFHSHDKLKLSLAFVVGIVIAYSITFIEPAGLH